jgi:hypothetical protein
METASLGKGMPGTETQICVATLDDAAHWSVG